MHIKKALFRGNNIITHIILFVKYIFIFLFNIEKIVIIWYIIYITVTINEVIMKIVVLDRASLGEDTPFARLDLLGEVISYDATDSSECVERLKGASVAIINKVKMTREVLSKAPDLRLICLFATGYDNVDIAAAKEMGIGVCNVPGYSTDSVALLTVSLALALSTHLYEYREFVASGDYTRSGVPNRLTPVYHELRGKTWGIVGYGNIGAAVGRVAEALGARVLAFKRTPIDNVECTDIDTLCRESDIITLHCPLNEQTREIINAERLSIMKDGVIIVNAARGAVVNEEDIARFVENKRIGGFGSDVYSEEPFSKEHPFSRIMKLPNVILTPHTAWGAYESRARCMDIVCENIKSFFEGKNKNRVDI